MAVDVSIVVPCRNGQLLGDCVASLLAQDFPHERYEVIVVDDASEPPLAAHGVRVLRHETPRGPNAARNTGLREARGDLLCLVDDDVEAPPTWLSALVAAAGRHPDAACFAGRILLRLEGRHPRMCGRCPVSETKLDLGEEEREIDGAAFGANMAIRRDAYERVGPFAESQPIYYDEVEWQERLRRAGGTIVYVPDAWLWHRRSAEDLRLRNLLARRYRFGYGVAAFRQAQGVRLRLRDSALGIPRLLAHGLLHGCSFGLLGAAEALGTSRRALRRGP